MQSECGVDGAAMTSEAREIATENPYIKHQHHMTGVRGQGRTI